MPARIIERVVADLRAGAGASAGASAGPAVEPGVDAALLDAFLARHDQGAFSALVQRHGPMVLGVCRRILGHAHDAEDAFQAVFWVLARKAQAVRPRAWVGNWLYGVAVRTALKARTLRRRRRELQVNAMPPNAMPDRTAPLGAAAGDDTLVLDREIERLPAKYRLAVVLCELEGHSRKEAARQLANRPGKAYFPTVEVSALQAPAATAYLANSYIPIELSDADFDAADAGAVVTRYLYVDEEERPEIVEMRVMASRTRPSADGKVVVVAILRVGGIDLEPEEAAAPGTPPR